MPNGKSRPLAAPFFNQDALWKHGIAYAGNAPALVDRQNYAENGNKNSRRDHKTPFQANHTKEITMTAAEARKAPVSTPNVSNHQDIEQIAKAHLKEAANTFAEMASSFKELTLDNKTSMQAWMATQKDLANINVGFEGLKGLGTTVETLSKATGELGGVVSASTKKLDEMNTALATNTEAVNQVLTHVDDGFMAQDKVAKAIPVETVMQKNKFFSRDNVKGDVRTVSVAGIGVGIVLGIKAIVEAIFSDPQPMQVPVRKAA